jgi:hypothetical protein
MLSSASVPSSSSLSTFVAFFFLFFGSMTRGPKSTVTSTLANFLSSSVISLLSIVALKYMRSQMF